MGITKISSLLNHWDFHEIHTDIVCDVSIEHNILLAIVVDV